MNSFLIFFFIIVAALFHAIWNALVKHAEEREVVLGFVALGHFTFGFILMLGYPLPASEVWKWILVSSLVHYLYYFFLNHAYRRGDLSVVYPIARGLAPPLVALGGMVFADELLSPLTWTGIFVSSIGLIVFAIPGNSGNRKGSFSVSSSVMISGLTGVTISAYSLIDGLGGRRADDPLSYVAWLFIFELPVFLWLVGKNRHRLTTLPFRVYRNGVFGGWLAASAYGFVIYAKSLTELGMVSVLRETSIVFVALIGIVFLKERPWKGRLLASSLVGAGVVILFIGY